MVSKFCLFFLLFVLSLFVFLGDTYTCPILRTTGTRAMGFWQHLIRASKPEWALPFSLL